MAGLSSAALLFNVAVVYHKLNQTVACTSQWCASRSCTKHVHPAAIKTITFMRGKKHDLASVAKSKPVAYDQSSTTDPTAGAHEVSKKNF